MATHAVDSLERRALRPLIEHARETLSELHNLAEREPKYKRAVVAALQTISISLAQGTIAHFHFDPTSHVEMLANAYIEIFSQAPIPHELLVHTVTKQVQDTLAHLSLKRSASEDDDSLPVRDSKRVARAYDDTLQQVLSNNSYFKELPLALRANKELLYAACRYNLNMLAFAHTSAYKDKELLLGLIGMHPHASKVILSYAHESIKTDSNFLWHLNEIQARYYGTAGNSFEL